MKFLATFALASFWTAATFAQDAATLDAMTSDTTKLNISGYAFGDYSYSAMRDTAITKGNTSAKGVLTGAKNDNAFQFRRIYLTFDDKITDKFSMRVRFEDNQAEIFSNNTMGAYIKEVWFRYKGIFPGSDLTVGEQLTPAFPISEMAWAFRYLEKTIMDVHSIVSAADLGVSLRGKIDDAGIFNYWAMVGNGAGTGAPENNKFKDYYLNILIKPVKNLQITLYGDYKPGAPLANGGYHDTTLAAFFAGYGERGLYNFGFEFFTRNVGNAYTLPGTTTTASLGTMGYTVFGTWYPIQDILGLVVRYDSFDPNTNSVSNHDLSHLLIAGVTWKLDRNVWFAPNIEEEFYQDAVAANGKPVSVSPSLSVRGTFFYIF